MTVCIAAICTWQNQPMIVGASDRMVSVQDAEYEPSQTKIANLSTNAVALVAGDASAQMEIGAHEDHARLDRRKAACLRKQEWTGGAYQAIRNNKEKTI